MISGSRHLLKCPDNAVAPVKTTIQFSISDKTGSLDDCLATIESMQISLTRIESHPSGVPGWGYDFTVDFNAANYEQVSQVVKSIESFVNQVQIVNNGEDEAKVPDSTPWFPRKLTDLDQVTKKVSKIGEGLASDSPGANDAAYCARRTEIIKNAETYKIGQPIPFINYSRVEIETWAVIYNKLTSMFPAHACKEYQDAFSLMVENCGYGPHQIPQLEVVSKFLKSRTGFTLRPVKGIVPSRYFLSGLAFRVFYATQYIRHHTKPLYSNEPDICHELLGHAALFADPDFADLSQEIGLASLGASCQDLKRLTAIYWFTVEFGLCRQGDQIRAYGGGLLSSFGELEYCLSDKPEIRPFEPVKVAQQKFPFSEYQPVYFVTESFKDAKMRIREFTKSLSRPFSVRYNANTESIEILDPKEKIIRCAQSTDIPTLAQSLESLAQSC
ncbi:hypothetical protein BGX21_011025 [Mortierella sp. AD011]|nr:hypothetical protein BGX20_002001 [Mortierella sp. AD010]KAF9392359.1 hypothetical protein BGX21_011025 [Mortierella sp. AD011]